MTHSIDDQTLQRFAAADIAAPDRQAITQLPVIDVSPFLRPSTDAERQSVAQQVRDACINIGFFYIAGHDFSPAELDDILDQGNRFFALPLDDKLKIAARNNPMRLGFIQVGGINPATQAATQADLKERLFLSRELEPGESFDPTSQAGQSQWPNPDTLPGFTPAMQAHTAKTVTLAQALLRLFSLSLHLPETTLGAVHQRMECSHAFNHYPPNTAPENPTWGFTPHTDYGSFTILLQDRNGGLQARNAAGQWIAVPPQPDTLVVNVADLFARLTNDIYVSTLHRVVNTTPASRLSLSFFLHPDPHAEIAPLPACISPDHPARYEPVIAGEYVAALLSQAQRTGRAGVSQRTAERLESGQ